MNKVVMGVIFWILALLIGLLAVFVIMLPADAEYNRRFASHVTMAYDQASFEGVKEQVLILWAEMNKTFGTEDLDHIYSSPWYWEQTYDNSLKAQEDYFRKLIERIDKQIYEAEQILAGNRTILMPYNQWYQEALDSLRAEMKREGGLDWALRPAWYLHCAPAAYWLLWWLVPLETFFILGGIILFIIGTEEAEY